MKIKNIFGHLKTITKHKWVVFKLCVKVGIPIRGILHDLSKYSPTEFFESVKYYQGGKRSPIPIAREDKGYSDSWLHHKGRNKHHFEYWNDADAKEPPVLPFKYSLEMICDKIAAGMVYQGKNWKKEFVVEYWNTREKNKVLANPKMKAFLTEVLTEVSENGIDKTLYKKHIKEIYDRYCM